MIKVIKEEIEIEESLKQRILIICDFCNTTPTIINGSIRKICNEMDEYAEEFYDDKKDKEKDDGFEL